VLRYLLDEQLSPEIARQLRLRSQTIPAYSVHDWHEGKFRGRPDSEILEAAHEDRLTLVTYDLQTIPSLLRELGDFEIPHHGVIFIDNRTIASSDVGALVRALTEVWKAYSNQNWINRSLFLTKG
jgi:predicted nuclease of predicted toxin-antitoxin system